MRFYVQQLDANLSQANPVSGAYYTVLPLNSFVRILSAAFNITWAITQPTNMALRMVVDLQTEVYQASLPVSATWYPANLRDQYPSALTEVVAGEPSNTRSFLKEGTSIIADITIIWAINQPSPLVCRIKWARYI